MYLMTRDPKRRADLIGRLADHVLAHGLGSASLRPLAAAVGTSDRMLLYYFDDKATLVATVLAEVAQRMSALLAAQIGGDPQPRPVVEARLLPLLLDDAVWPYMALWLEIAGRAARGDAVCAAVGEEIGRGFLAWASVQIETGEGERDAEAARLMITLEGAVLLKALGMDDAVAKLA